MAAERALQRYERAQRDIAMLERTHQQRSSVLAVRRRAALRAMLDAGMTQEGIAKLCRIDRKTVVRWLGSDA